MGMVLRLKLDHLVRSCCKIERIVVVIFFLACKEYRIRRIKISNRRFKHTHQLSVLKHLIIIERSSISKLYFLSSYFRFLVCMWYKKHSLQYIDIWYGHFQSPPSPSGLPIRFKVTEVYRKGPWVLKQGHSKVFQTGSETHTSWIYIM